MQNKPEKVYIIIPTYNERENLPDLVMAIEKIDLSYDWWIYVIDDNSPDGTGKIADDLALRGKRVKVIHRPKKEGLGSAYKAGFDQALEDGANYIVTMDADLSHNPAYLPELIEEAAHSGDLVIGSRYIEGGKLVYPLGRRLLSRLANSVARTLLGLSVLDATAGFKCYRAVALSKIGYNDFISNGYLFQVESHASAQRNRLKIIEIPITFYDRISGQTKMTPKEAYQGLWYILKLFYKERKLRK